MNSSQSQTLTETSSCSQQPTLVFDLKKNRIRIHKKTLHLLGDPDYVQFLVNPETKTIAIRAREHEDKTTEKIRWQYIGGRQCCEFYSKFLIMRLRYYCYNWDSKCLYRVTGAMFPEENIAAFRLTDSVAIENEFDYQESE